MFFVWKLRAIEWSHVFFHSHLIVVLFLANQKIGWRWWAQQIIAALYYSMYFSYLCHTMSFIWSNMLQIHCDKSIYTVQYIYTHIIINYIHIFIYTHNYIHIYIYMNFHLAPWTSWLKASSNDSFIEALREEFGTSSQRFVAQTWGWPWDGFRYSTHTI